MTANRRDRAELGVTPPEYALFIALHYGINVPPSSLPSAAEREDYDPTGPGVTEAECRVALAGCLANGWLQVIDETALDKIKEDLRDGGFIGPIYGLPPVGGVDFTIAGAEIWQRISRHECSGESHPPFAYTDVVHSKTARFFRSRVAALASMEEARQQVDVVSVTGPTPIGPWRVQWWRKFPEGYRIDIEERRQWEGLCGGGGSWCMPPERPDKADLPRLRHVLDRHNVSLSQWLFLSVMDRTGTWMSASNVLDLAAACAERNHGLTIPQEELRGGLDECFRYGWLRTLDHKAVDEIQALLRDDPALQSLFDPATNHWGEIDFTSSGAALYCMIANECLGPEWENSLSVEKGYYWEEHRYCESLEGFQSIVEEHEGMGAVVRAGRVVPIGPWCVHWWDRFPAGYRLELQIGEG